MMMKICSICGREYPEYFVDCPDCKLSCGKNNKANKGKYIDNKTKEAIDKKDFVSDKNTDNSSPIFLLIANTIAIAFFMLSYAIIKAGFGKGLGGFGYAIVGGWCGIIGFFVSLFFLPFALGRREKPIWAYFTCLLVYITGYYLFFD